MLLFFHLDKVLDGTQKLEEKQSFILCTVCGISVAALNLEPMRRKHVHETICNGKTNPVKDGEDFREHRSSVQIFEAKATDVLVL